MKMYTHRNQHVSQPRITSIRSLFVLLGVQDAPTLLHVLTVAHVAGQYCIPS